MICNGEHTQTDSFHHCWLVKSRLSIQFITTNIFICSQIEPQLKQLYESVAALLKEYFEGLLDVVAHFAALVSDFFEKHKAELEELTNTFAEIFKGKFMIWNPYQGTLLRKNSPYIFFFWKSANSIYFFLHGMVT